MRGIHGMDIGRTWAGGILRMGMGIDIGMDVGDTKMDIGRKNT